MILYSLFPNDNPNLTNEIYGNWKDLFLILCVVVIEVATTSCYILTIMSLFLASRSNYHYHLRLWLLAHLLSASSYTNIVLDFSLKQHS